MKGLRQTIVELFDGTQDLSIVDVQRVTGRRYNWRQIEEVLAQLADAVCSSPEEQQLVRFRFGERCRSWPKGLTPVEIETWIKIRWRAGGYYHRPGQSKEGLR